MALALLTFNAPPSLANEDYLDQRWDKTGCKPLDEKTKKALIPTDVTYDDYDYKVNAYTLKNRQYFIFNFRDVKEYKGYAIIKSMNNKSKPARIKQIRTGHSIRNDLFKEYFSIQQINENETWLVDVRTGLEKGACTEKWKKNRRAIYTVYLFKNGIGKTYPSDSKKYDAYKWLSFQPTGKGFSDKP